MKARRLKQDLFAAFQFEHFCTFAQRQQTCLGINAQLGSGVHDVQIAHGELTNAVQRREGGFAFFHRQTLGVIREVGRCGVQNGVVIAAAQLDGDLACDGACHPALSGFAQHQRL